MKRTSFKRVHSRNPIFPIVITFAMAIAMTESSGSVFSISRAKTSAQQTTGQESKQTEVRELKLGLPVERELAGGESHSYRIRLTVGQYLEVVINQKGIDVVARLFGPDTKKVSEVDNDPAIGEERLFAVAEASGDFTLEVQSSNKSGKSGHYVLTIKDLREATSKDRVQVGAEKNFEEGNHLRDQQTTESRRQAIEKYQASLLLWQDVGNKEREAYTLNELGAVNSGLGDPNKAREYYSRALLLWRAVGNSLNEANALNNIGLVSWRMSEFQKGLEFLEQALPLRRKAGDERGEAVTLNNIGLIHHNLGDLQKALAFYDQSMPLRRAVGDGAGEASTLTNIGEVQRRLGEMQKSLDHYEQALPLWRSAGNRRGEGLTLNNIGVVYVELGEPKKALEYYGLALPLRHGAGDRQGEAQTLHNLGRVYSILGERQKALEYYDQALALFRAVSDRSGAAYVLTSIGETYALSAEHRKALDYFEQSLSLRRTIGDRYGEAYTLTNIGLSYTLLGEQDKALEYFRQALNLNRAVSDRIGEAKTLFAVARLERDRGNLTEARTRIESALDIIESTRSKITTQELRTSFLASRQSFYEFYLELLMRMHATQPLEGHDQAAFAASERARARSLLELLTEARIEVRQGIAPELKRREKDVQSRISLVQSQLIQANSRVKPDGTRIQALEDEFKKVQFESEQIETEIRKKHPRYATLHYPTPLGLKAIQQSLDENTVLLEYALGREVSFLFAISRNDFLTAQLPAASVLTDQVATLRQAVSAKPDRMALSNYLQSSRALYRSLVEPASRMLTGKQALIIVPDGILHYLSFATLLQSDGGRKAQIDLRKLPYLLRNYAISYAPSATVLVNLPTPDQTIRGRTKTLLAFGDPVYGKTESEQTSPVRSAVRSAFGEDKPWQLQPLPESRNEVEQIAKLFPRTQANIFLAEQATEENVKAEDRASQYRFVHFAVHGLLNENKPQYSGLVLSLPGTEREQAKKKGHTPSEKSTRNTSDIKLSMAAEDGLLQVYEIFNLKINADLVVLSACESGLGKETKGEGLVGLTQAFLYSGTPTLAVSLWKVQDRSTAELMVRLYRHLNTPGVNKAQALRQAQLEMVRGKDFSHPYYWAGFVLTGRP